MPRVIDFACVPARLSLGEVTDRLATRGFDPADEESLIATATDLRALGEDRTFLGDLLIDSLKDTFRAAAEAEYGPQVIMLAQPGSDCFLRANIWPAADDAAMRASGGSVFAFDLPHDHNFDFLTLGYFGPGYWSDYYEYDYEAVAGWSGEPVDLRFTERARLSEGKVMLYRAHRDVHVQHPADALSVSINVMHMAPHQNWFDQYGFDVSARTITRVMTQGASEIALRFACALGIEDGLALARDFGARHPSDRMRLAAWEGLALAAPDEASQDRVWADAEAAGSRMVAMEAKARRLALA